MITVKLKGGLGNQMFQYALGRALSLKHNVPLSLDLGYLLDHTPRAGFTFRDYALDVFALSVKLLKEKEILMHKIIRKIIPRKGKEKSFAFDPTILLLKDGVYLDGYWQSEKYFSGIADVIRKDFTLKKLLPEKYQIIKNDIEQTASVSMHIRRGDYVNNAFHPTLDMDYYKSALAYISEKTIVEKVYIFSDDMAWCKEHVVLDVPTVFVNEEYAGKYDEGHMMLMSACKHFIIANSSFSWWAAWLSENKDKIVVAPKKWFNDDTNTDDLIPEHWIRM